MSIFLKIQDTVDGKLGSVYLTIDGRRYEVPGIQKIEAHDVVKERTLKHCGHSSHANCCRRSGGKWHNDNSVLCYFYLRENH